MSESPRAVLGAVLVRSGVLAAECCFRIRDSWLGLETCVVEAPVEGRWRDGFLLTNLLLRGEDE